MVRPRRRYRPPPASPARQDNARLDIAARAGGEDGEFHAGPGSLCGLCRRLTIRATMSPRLPSIIRQSDGIAQPTGDDALRRCADCQSRGAEIAADDLPGLSAVYGAGTNHRYVNGEPRRRYASLRRAASRLTSGQPRQSSRSAMQRRPGSPCAMARQPRHCQRAGLSQRPSWAERTWAHNSSASAWTSGDRTGDGVMMVCGERWAKKEPSVVPRSRVLEPGTTDGFWVNDSTLLWKWIPPISDSGSPYAFRRRNVRLA